MGRLAGAAAVDSSPSSASSFRELDEVFLQNQTRIWLGEVLSTRLDEDLHISDLLQDGEILFKVSKVVWNLLLTKCMELKHLKLTYGPFGSNKSSGRYRPYSNVDSFIKICKILGMSGIDLFSPSDVVEKRDIRKVCICVRALSKKARSKKLSVPDFDVVMYSLAMPTDMVEGIRRSLESSQCTTSSSYNSYKASRRKPKLENVHAPSNREYDSSSEESDEAESRYMGEYAFCSTSKFDEDDYDVDGVSSEQGESPEVFSSEVRHSVGESSRISEGERNYISDYLAFSDLMVHASDSSSTVVLDGANNMFDFFLNVDSQGDKKSHQKKFSDDENMEVSSTTSMSSVLGRMLNFEFGDMFDADECSSTDVRHETENTDKDTYKLSKFRKTETCEASFSEHEITPRWSCVSAKDCPLSPRRCQSGVKFLEGESCGTVDAEDEFCGENGEEVVIDNNHEIPLCDDKGNQTIVEDEIVSSSAANENQDERKHNLDIPVKNTGDGKTDGFQRPLLKTVVKGTVIAGVLFLLLHIRKNSGTNPNQTKQQNGVAMVKESKFSSKKQQTGRIGKGIYPAEKLRL